MIRARVELPIEDADDSFRELPEPIRFDSCDLDPNAEVGPALADHAGEVFEGELAVLARVAGDDIAAAPPHHLVNSQILEMPPIREINVRAGIVRKTECLPDNGGDRRGRAFLTPRLRTCPARIP